MGWIARCVAPAITLEKLEEWPGLFGQVDDATTRGSLEKLLAIVIANKQGQKYQVPERAEREWLAGFFDGLAEPVRTPAFHILWYVNELALGRNPG